MEASLILPPIIATAVPPVLFAAYCRYGARISSTTHRGLVARSFILGLGISVPIYLLESAIPASDLVVRVVTAPVIEELVKFGAFSLIIWRPSLSESKEDLILCVAAVALGFATIENAWFLRFELSGSSGPGPIAVLRPFITVPAHVLFTLTWGHTYLAAVRHAGSIRIMLVIAGLVPAVLLHSLFNYAVLWGLQWMLGALAVTAVVSNGAAVLFKRDNDKDPG